MDFRKMGKCGLAHRAIVLGEEISRHPGFQQGMHNTQMLRALLPCMQGVLEAIEKLQNEAFSLGRDNEQYKARLRQQHKVMLTQMDMITYLEALLKLKVLFPVISHARFPSSSSSSSSSSSFCVFFWA
jgi:hypothetical protein